MSNRIRLVQSKQCTVERVEMLGAGRHATRWVRVHADGFVELSWLMRTEEQPRVGDVFTVTISRETK